jgi:nitrogen regulatory protein PII
MKFSIIVAIVSEELEEKAIKSAKDAGAGGVTILNGRGMGLKEKKIFGGLATLESKESVMIFIVPTDFSFHLLKTMTKDLELDEKGHGVVFSLPLEHIKGIPFEQLKMFEDKITPLI